MSRMMREFQVRFCEGLGVQIPRATRLVVLLHGTEAHAEALREEIADLLREKLGNWSP